MVQLNAHFKKLKREYVFPIIERKLAEVREKHPRLSIVNLGVGDVALPLVPHVAEAICKATQEMTTRSGMRGYGPSEGYSFLREAISQKCYPSDNISPEEIFISDGTNGDATNIQELFSAKCKIGIPDPTYPAYLDTAIIGGRLSKVVLLPCTEETGFSPVPPQEHLDIVYLCSPNNPTGVAMTRTQLKTWVDYARRENAVLLLDNAYEAFVTSPDVPRSIYEIEGAKEVAIEFRSFSKSAGFTGLRCAYTVVPKALQQGKLHAMWMKRQSIKFNGVSYPIQKGAEAALSLQGLKETKAQVQQYLEQGKVLNSGLGNLGFSCVGGHDAPYVWWKVPAGKTSWEFFDEILEKCHLISIPGRGFGRYGEGYIRLSTFTTAEQAQLALERLGLLMS
jgi:LL-diaminopimelate aminotransferase